MRRAVAAVTTMAVALLTVACAAGGGGATTTPATTASGSPAASGCVGDPDAVLARTDALPTTAMPTAMSSSIDQAAREGWTQAAAPGAIVAVQSPSGLFLQAYGVADPSTGAPMTTDMFQRVGSVTKTFTGTLLLQLVADGRVSLDDPVSRWVDGVPDGDAVTLRMLLDMTSGIPSYTKDAAWQQSFFSQPERVWAPDELLAAGLALPPEFAPGEGFDYSNTNTVLVGKVVEAVTGEDIATAMTERILTPLGLDDTSFPGDSAVLPDPHPRGFTLQGDVATPDAPVDATDWNPSWGWTAGEVISTAPDLLVYARDVATGAGLVSADVQRERLTSFGAQTGYGLAMVCSHGWVGHTGELPGFNTTMYYDTADDITVVTMTNSDIPSGDCGEGATLTDDPGDLVCSAPATRILVAVTTALGRAYAPPGS